MLGFAIKKQQLIIQLWNESLIAAYASESY